ncbi:MAG: DsbA family protein [Qipengyuania vulgaris]
MTRSLRFALLAPLTLMAAACGGGAEEADATSLEGEAIAPIEAPAGTNWADQVTVTEYDGYLKGNPDAPLKLVEYASLTCPTCARFAVEGDDALIENYVNTGVVSFELRNQIHGPHDLALATLVRCGTPEAVHPLSKQIFANQQQVLQGVFDNGEAIQQSLNLPPETRMVTLAEIAGFYDFFAARGISEDQARTCLADVDAYETIANNSTSQSEEFEVTGTPTFFLNGNRVEANMWAQLEPILQRAGAR